MYLTIFNNEITILKYHHTNIDAFINLYSKDYELYFICSEREEINKTMDKKFHNYRNVLIFKYEELLETETYTVEDIVNHCYDKIKKLLPQHIRLDKEKSTKRVKIMNELCEGIKDRDFSYYDHYYHIHGSHRGREHYGI